MTDISIKSCVWCFPVVGVVIGTLVGLVMLALGASGLPFSLQCLFGLMVGICLTGALHEDGLADFCDGLGVFDRSRALEVMHDSRVGGFGALALVFSFCWRGVALYELQTMMQAVLGIFLMHVGARGVMSVMLLFPLARSSGLAHKAGRASWFAVALALSFTVLMFLVFLPWHIALISLGAGILGVALIVLIAMKRYGGMTGDIYGAGEQVCEMMMLGVFASLVPLV